MHLHGQALSGLRRIVMPHVFSCTYTMLTSVQMYLQDSQYQKHQVVCFCLTSVRLIFTFPSLVWTDISKEGFIGSVQRAGTWRSPSSCWTLSTFPVKEHLCPATKDLVVCRVLKVALQSIQGPPDVTKPKTQRHMKACLDLKVMEWQVRSLLILRRLCWICYAFMSGKKGIQVYSKSRSPL